MCMCNAVCVDTGRLIPAPLFTATPARRVQRRAFAHPGVIDTALAGLIDHIAVNRAVFGVHFHPPSLSLGESRNFSPQPSQITLMWRSSTRWQLPCPLILFTHGVGDMPGQTGRDGPVAHGASEAVAVVRVAFDRPLLLRPGEESDVSMLTRCGPQLVLLPDNVQGPDTCVTRCGAPETPPGPDTQGTVPAHHSPFIFRSRMSWNSQR